MRGEALYQKYRSQTFDEVVGQEYVVRSIRNAVKEQKVGHAYLFCGPRGTGKTSMARLLARAVNCENSEEAPCGHCPNCLAAIEGTHPDIIEINAANETHVEDVRDLIERARLAPMMGHHKIYIVDEVHQLSSSAASALLKTLEEPPEHVIFVLATTDPQKLLPTIISRCQRFDFSKVKTSDIQKHLLNIAEKENVTLTEEAAIKIASLADGGMRDSLSMLDQAIAYCSGNITAEAIDEIYGLTSVEEKMDFVNAIHKQDIPFLLEHIESYEEKGIDFKRLTTDLINIYKDIVIYNKTSRANLLRILNEQQAKDLRYLANEALKDTDIFMDALNAFRTTQSVSNVFEIACLKITCMNDIVETPVVQVESKKETPIVQPVKVEVKKETSIQQEDSSADGEDTPILEAHEKVFDTTKILQILVQCDKENKSKDQDRIKTLVNGLAIDKYIAAIRQLDLKASGKDCLLFTTSSQAVCNTLNSEEMNEGLYEYLKTKVSIDKMPFIILDEEYMHAVNDFKEKMKNKNLPEPLKIVRYIKEEKKEEKGETLDSETKLRNMFGDDITVYD